MAGDGTRREVLAEGHERAQRRSACHLRDPWRAGRTAASCKSKPAWVALGAREVEGSKECGSAPFLRFLLDRRAAGEALAKDDGGLALWRLTVRSWQAA
ncbi:hypothetical protein KC329_g25 [Hortaea werneckii]|nr:hypothetical protein KC329_g25 [Hortaea werneckii]